MTQNTNRHFVDEIAHNKLFEYEVAPPIDVWDKINDKLHKRKLRLWWITAGAMAATVALIISAGLGYYFGSNHQKIVSSNNNIHQTTNNIKNSQTNESKNITKTINENIALSDNKPSVSNGNIVSYKTIHEQKLPVEPNEEIVLSNEYSSQIIEPMQRKEFSGFNENNNYLFFNELKNSNSKIIKQAPIEVTQEKKKEPIVWALGGNLAPSYSYRTIQKNGSNYSTAQLNSSEKPNLSVSGGFNLKFGRRKWRIETGLYYNQISFDNANAHFASSTLSPSGSKDLGWGPLTATEQLAYSKITDNASIESSSGSIRVSNNVVNSSISNYIANNGIKLINSEYFNNKEVTLSTRQIFRYIEIPVLFKFQLFNRYSEINFTGGLSTNILFANQVLQKQNNSYSYLGYTEHIRKFSLASIIGFSYEVPIVPGIYLSFEPRLTYYLNSISSNSAYGLTPYSMGLFTGVSYRF